MAQVGLGRDVMPDGRCLRPITAPLSSLYFGFHYGFSGISFVLGWNTAEVFLLLPPHLFDLFLYLRFG